MVQPSLLSPLVPMLLLMGIVGCQRDAGTPGDDISPPVVREAKGPDSAAEARWGHSADGRVGCRVWVEKKSLAAEEPIVLNVEIQNRGIDSRTFLRPCIDTNAAFFHGLELVGPQGEVPYRGTIFCGTFPPEAFVTLASGETVRDELELPLSIFPQSDVPGVYTIRYRYISVERSHPHGLEDWDLWIGEAPGQPVEVRKR